MAKVLIDTTGLQWHDCEVVNGARGEPVIETRGTVLEAERRRGVARWLVSLSHDGDMAIAFVVAGGEEAS